MCGICGIINYNQKPVEKNNITQMMQKMKHRGPDDEGIFIENNIGLGFVRLSILDLSEAGHQPMYSHNKRYVIVFNGEVYNYIEIREQLKTKGFNFKSNTDTEVILAAYNYWGKACLNKFNGMWAFVIYDHKTNEIFGARDRFGIKPFYYIQNNTSFIFASEIRAIKEVYDEKLTENDDAIFDYLAFNRTDHGNSTFYKEINKIPHGCYFTIDTKNKFNIQQWYNLEDNCNKDEINSDEFRELLLSSIKLRMRSDVPVGVCLSGGLDSSTISSLLSKKAGYSDINTFSAVYSKRQIGDESDFISELNPILNNMHYITPTSKTLEKDLFSFINAMGEPVPSTGPYAQFKVMQLAKKHVTVTLDGQGADEQLAGYHYFYGYYFKELLKQYRIGKLSYEMFHYLSKHKSLYGIKTLGFFLLPEHIRLKTRVQRVSYITNSFFQENQKENIIAGKLYGAESLQKAMVNHFEYKLEHLLKWEDHNAMWSSIESRVPFLDYRLVEQTLSLENDKYINKGLTKHILRESMKSIVPEIIRLRYDKVGFATPQDEWFRIPYFKNLIDEILNSNDQKFSKYVNLTDAKKLYSDHLNHRINCSKDIWKWINLYYWLEL